MSDAFTIDGISVTDRQIIAIRFNKFYVNIGPSLEKNIPVTQTDPEEYLDIPNMNSIFLASTDELEVSKIIKNLKISSPGWDNVSSKVVKNAYQYFVRPLVHILNISLMNGHVPRELKIARVMPIFKSGDKKIISNYRPVSVLPCFSKILEKLVYKRMINFITKYDILYKYQFGFREKHGTSLALSFLIDNIVSAHEKGQCVLGIFIDFSKAFDTVNHQILYKKLANYGIRGMALNWIKSYLSDRTQFVEFQGVKSGNENITCGVPQGSILGPLLFLLYVNDIVKASQEVLTILFADDTNIFKAGTNIDMMISSMNNELDNIVKWLQANKLSLNVKKTHYIIFKPGRTSVSPTSNIRINNQIVQQEMSTTFLGVVLDSKLSWGLHVQKIKMKMSKSIGIISKARKILNRKTLLTLYYSFIYPYMSYCVEVWGNAAKTYTDSLLKLQKLCCRIITGSKRLTPSEPLFRCLKILKLPDIYEYSVMLFMFKFYNGLLPQTMSTLFQQMDSTKTMVTRQRHNLLLPCYKSLTACNSIRFQGSKIWNKYHKEFNLQCSYFTFKHHFKMFILNRY